ncbi:MAG: WD40/YVTN/BNR-like repeat-containing protein, partial [Gemmatimonadaceae bacterium]
TMPINWSPLDPNTLYYVSNAVWKTTDGGKDWTRISPDLARQIWDVPGTAGKYASTVKPAPLGTITALSPSPRDINVIWAGTDDGNIQVTTDGGAKWTNVTPPQIKPWTRIFNIEAGHFDANTAYAAANSMRVDDMNPHLWRTHDGGRTWTEIDNGIAAGTVTNSIREDPKVKGLLYGSTDTQVWVSYDDGDHWQSLRINMPAISVRDLQLKDDAACLCSDLIAATHGRGFWILDDVTPLRARATAGNTPSSSYLVKPATAVRVRFAENDPTPWPPEVPAGENPPAGAVIDYFLRANAGKVDLQIVDAGGKIIRSYSSTDTISGPDPALQSAEYNEICQRNTSAPHCDVPLYWAAPNAALSSRAGMHRFIWDMRYDPIQGTSPSETGAVPHRTYLVPNTPWAAPGSYTVRLVADGKTYTQPLELVLDPRVKTPASAIAQVSTLSREMYDAAVALRGAYVAARKMSDRLTSPSDAALKSQIDSIAPPAVRVTRRGFGFRQAA